MKKANKIPAGLSPSTHTEKTEIMFLGTGAADWPLSPNDYDKDALPSDFRRFSSALVNNNILIDCPQHVPATLKSFKLNPLAITDMLLTHSHSDHLDSAALHKLAGAKSRKAPLRVWAHAGALAKIPAGADIEKHTVTIGRPWQLGPFTVEALAANHILGKSQEKGLHFLIRSSSSTFLYATDGAWFLGNTWYRLRSVHLDAIIIDATIGDAFDGDYRIFEHNSIAMIRMMMQTFRHEGVINDRTKIILTHLAMTLHPRHSQLQKSLQKENLIAAGDGMRFTL